MTQIPTWNHRNFPQVMTSPRASCQVWAWARLAWETLVYQLTVEHTAPFGNRCTTHCLCFLKMATRTLLFALKFYQDKRKLFFLCNIMIITTDTNWLFLCHLYTQITVMNGMDEMLLGKRGFVHLIFSFRSANK